jgi:hypothetical protein
VTRDERIEYECRSDSEPENGESPVGVLASEPPRERLTEESDSAIVFICVLTSRIGGWLPRYERADNEWSFHSRYIVVEGVGR